MPRLNYGTLLENIVVLETTRLCFDRLDPDNGVAFANSFAIPPLTECWCTVNDRQVSPDFDLAFLQGLVVTPNAQTLQNLWRLCMNNHPGLPICRRKPDAEDILHGIGGPNGALLASMLAAQLNRKINVWVNDDGGRYGAPPPAAPSAQTEFPTDLAAALAGTPATGMTTVDTARFPHTIPHLEAWIAQGVVPAAAARIGFLDPDNYIEGKPRAAKVTQNDHRQWLRALAAGAERALSVMFSGLQNRGQGNAERNQRLALFHDDEVELYPHSLMFEFSNYQTGVKIRWPENLIEQFAADLQKKIQDAWQGWSRGLKKKPLTVHVNGQPV